MSDLYGCQESNPITESVRTFQDSAEERIPWTDPRLVRITRLRLLSDPGFPFWDVSYCYGKLRCGQAVEVILPFDQLPKRGLKATIINYAKRDHVFAAGLGVFENISTLC